MEKINPRINKALNNEEIRAEQIANNTRLIFLLILTFLAILNISSISIFTTMMNFGALAVAYLYSVIVFIIIRRSGYKPIMKYITSAIDVFLVFLLLFLYTMADIPAVALKNYVFLIVFPLIILTTFRYDRLLTLINGLLSIILYLGLIAYLILSKSLEITNGGYERELFSSDVTIIGQVTKISILAVFISLATYLTKYTRLLINKLIVNEVNLQVIKETTDRELEIASQVQRKLLPHALPSISGLDVYGELVPGKFVAGDYYDFIKISETSLFVVIADVSGKGVPAALIMAEVRASTHLLATSNLPLEDFIQRLNTLLHQSTSSKDFVTYFAAEINVLEGNIKYVNAGHPPPFLFLQNQIKALSTRTLPLGALSCLPKFSVITEAFPVDSVIIFYTDGILEQTNKQELFFGEERIKIFLSENAQHDSCSIGKKLLDEIKNFADGAEPNDDITLAIVKHING